MISTKSLVKVLGYATFICLLALNLYIGFTVSRHTTAFNDEYTRNIARIDEQYGRINSNIDGLASGLGELTKSTQGIIGELETSIDRIEFLTSKDRELGDSSIELAVTSDRSKRLVQELERRLKSGELKESEAGNSD